MEHETITTPHINITENGTYLELYHNISVPVIPSHKDLSSNNSYYTIVLVGLGLAIYCVLYIRRRRNKKKDEEKREEEYLSYYHSILPQSQIYGGATPSDVQNMTKVIQDQKDSDTSVSYELSNVASLLLMEQLPGHYFNQELHNQNKVEPSPQEESITELIKQLQNESKESTEELLSASESVFTEEELTNIVELILLEKLKDTKIQEDKPEPCDNTDQKSREELFGMAEQMTDTNKTETLNLNNEPFSPGLKRQNESPHEVTESKHSAEIESKLPNDLGDLMLKPQGDIPIQNEQIVESRDIVSEQKGGSPVQNEKAVEFREKSSELQCDHDKSHNVFTISNDLKSRNKILSKVPKPKATNHSDLKDDLLPSPCTSSDMLTDTNANLIQKWDRKFRSHIQKHKPTVVVFHDDCLTATWI